MTRYIHDRPALRPVTRRRPSPHPDPPPPHRRLCAGDAERCPIARGAYDAIPGLQGVAIDRGTAYLAFAGNDREAGVDPRDVAVLDTFDMTKVFPAGYVATLLPPTGNRREGARCGKSGTNKPRPNARSVKRHLEQAGRSFRLPTIDR